MLLFVYLSFCLLKSCKYFLFWCLSLSVGSSLQYCLPLYTVHTFLLVLFSRFYISLKFIFLGFSLLSFSILLNSLLYLFYDSLYTWFLLFDSPQLFIVLHSSLFLWVAFCICLTFTPFTFLYKTFFLFFLILTGHMLEISFSFVFDNFSKVLKKYNFLIQGIHNIFSYPLNQTF